MPDQNQRNAPARQRTCKTELILVAADRGDAEHVPGLETVCGAERLSGRCKEAVRDAVWDDADPVCSTVERVDQAALFNRPKGEQMIAELQSGRDLAVFSSHVPTGDAAKDAFSQRGTPCQRARPVRPDQRRDHAGNSEGL